MNYYYFGWVNVDFLDRLTQTSNSIGFNLGTPFTAALAAVMIFGLVHGLARRLSPRCGPGRAAAFGLLGVLLLLFVSNLEGIFELLAAHRIGSAAFYSLIGVQGLEPGKASSFWYPDTFWFWWRATRMGSGYNIMEFPFFSFLLGDLHPHVMVMPFALLGLALVWNLFAGEEPLDGHWWRRQPVYLLVLGILLGALAVFNAWDQPVAYLILFALVLVSNWRRLQARPWPALRASLLFLLPVGLLSILLFLPYWAVLEKTDIVGIAPILRSTYFAGDARNSMTTPPLHLLLFWGPLFWLLLSFVAVTMWRSRGQAGRNTSNPALLLASLPVLVWLVSAAASRGAAGLLIELRDRGSTLLTLVILVFLLYLCLAALLHELARPSRVEGAEAQAAGSNADSGPVEGAGLTTSAHPEAVEGEPYRFDPALVFILVIASIAVFWILGAELFFVQQASVDLRYNTVFKLWYQAWLLLAVADAAGTAYLLRDLRLPAIDLRPAALAWGAATVLLLLGSLVYPVISTPNRVNGFRGSLDLDGLAYFRRQYPADYAASTWLSANANGSPVELEAEGGQLAGNFSAEGARISELTGLPTVLGWLEHEQIHHGILDPLRQRSQDIRTIYTTPDQIVARSLLQHYGVRYVVVGDLERQVYGDAGLAKFPLMGAAVFRSGGTTVYDLAQPAAASSGPRLPTGP
jgi:YYY domain-containing protein